MYRIKKWLIQNSKENYLLNKMLAIYDFLGGITWYVDDVANASRRRLLGFKDKYKNKRCFIIGNGPSLNKTDLSLLKNEFTFGLNRIYLKFGEGGFETTFLVSVNDLVLKQCARDFNKLKLPKFFTWKASNYIKFDRKTIFIRSLARPQFSKNLTKGVWEGATVTYVAMQLAYYMGFTQVILIGVDHSFKIKGDAHKEVVSKGVDPNHFDPNYFGKGFKWNLPDLDTSEYAYSLAKRKYEEDGRIIEDATIEGKLKVFKKIDYNKLFAN